MILTNQQLDTMLQNIIMYAYATDTENYNCLLCLYNTGLRYNEFYETNRWSKINAYSYLVNLEKGSSPRVILISQLTQMFCNYIDNNMNLYNYMRQDTMTRYIYKKGMYGKLYVGQKGVATHLFRYNYVRKLYDSGLSYAQIASDMGEVNVINTIAYGTHPIYF